MSAKHTFQKAGIIPPGATGDTNELDTAGLGGSLGLPGDGKSQKSSGSHAQEYIYREGLIARTREREGFDSSGPGQSLIASNDGPGKYIFRDVNSLWDNQQDFFGYPQQSLEDISLRENPPNINDFSTRFRWSIQELECLARRWMFGSTLGYSPRGLKVTPHTDPASGIQVELITKPVKGWPQLLIFRGTDSLLDVLFDLDAEGIGIRPFKSSSFQKWLLQHVDGPVISVGQSLGGALAQYVICPQLFSKAESVRAVVTFNSPGISKAQIDDSRKGISYHFVTKGDPASKAGYGHTSGLMQVYSSIGNKEGEFIKVAADIDRLIDSILSVEVFTLNEPIKLLTKKAMLFFDIWLRLHIDFLTVSKRVNTYSYRFEHSLTNGAAGISYADELIEEGRVKIGEYLFKMLGEENLGNLKEPGNLKYDINRYLSAEVKENMLKYIAANLINIIGLLKLIRDSVNNIGGLKGLTQRASKSF